MRNQFVTTPTKTAEETESDAQREEQQNNSEEIIPEEKEKKVTACVAADAIDTDSTVKK